MKHCAPIDVVRSGLCIGCGICVAQDAPGPRMIWNRFGQLQPTGPPGWLQRRSASFARTCPFSPGALSEDDLAADLFPHIPSPHPALGRVLSAFVGYAAEASLRQDGSSGGLVSWVLLELLRRGWIDGALHVTEAKQPAKEGPFFHYHLSRTGQEIRAGAKSRYYPVEMSGVLSLIRAIPGRYAVVGVPCFIKALQLLRREDPLLRERIAFTLGLFCGHMKSARFLESCAWQMGLSLDQVLRADFRRKAPERPANWYTVQFTLRDGRVLEKDWWHLADGDWGAGFFQASACNFCDDVVAETADIAFGDAWVEPYASDGRGTNVVLVRSARLAGLISAGIREERLRLDPVDLALVEQTQAAGFRQRREGLAYRLTWRRPGGIRPRKRVAPDRRHLSARRKLIYRLRAGLSFGSHWIFLLAQELRCPALYLGWARAALALYQGVARYRGRLGRLLQWLDQRRIP